MSSELLPQSHGRGTWNRQHGQNLEAHNSLLDAEQAERINKHYEIELYFGTHGIPIRGPITTSYQFISLPTQQEYDAAAGVVEKLEPGDVLFTEGIGFKAQPEPPVDISALDTGASSSLFKASIYEWLNYSIQLQREEIEKARMAGKINAWGYAERLAHLKGVQVVYADHDAFEKQCFAGISGGKNVVELMMSDSPQECALAESLHLHREYKARNTIKDWALAHLPDPDMPMPERKPKLALLFGAYHQTGLVKAFGEMGLTVQVEELASASLEERAHEQLMRLAHIAIASTIPHLKAGMLEWLLPENS